VLPPDIPPDVLPPDIPPWFICAITGTEKAKEIAITEVTIRVFMGFTFKKVDVKAQGRVEYPDPPPTPR
jgi:hypothetical protein